MNMYSGNSSEPFLFFNCVSSHSIFMKRVLLQNILPFSSQNFHDWQIAYKATNIGSILYINMPLVFYRQHPSSDTNILKIKRVKKTKYETSNSFESLKHNVSWLKECSLFYKNRNPKFVSQVLESVSLRMESYISLNLVRLLYKHRTSLYFISKKSRASKLNFIMKQVWGSKTKEIWDKNFKRK